MRPYRRRIYLVDRQYQLRFIFWLLAGVLLTALLTGFLTYVVAAREIRASLYSVHIATEHSGQVLLTGLVWVNICCAFILVALTVLVVALHIRHISGSLRRFNGHIAGMLTGAIPWPIYFRKNDPLHGTAAAFNVMVEALRSRFAESRAKSREAVSLLTETEKGFIAGKPTTAADLRRVRQLLAEASAELEGCSGP